MDAASEGGMTMSDTRNDLVLVERESSVATVVLNRPEQLNTLDIEMGRALPPVLERLAFESGVRVIVITGAGQHFMAGGDIRTFEEHLGHGTEDDLVDVVRGFQRCVKLLRRAKKPVLAKVRGNAAGGGLSLMLACDLVIAADDARFSTAYTSIGASPDGGMTFHLPRIVGMKKAMELVLLSEIIDAETALQLGLVNWVVPASELDARADAVVQRLAKGPTRAFERSKALLNAAFSRDTSDQLEAEAESFVDLFAGSKDFAEGVHAFLQKRAPEFRGK
jgi:2-(1,2-epoxy-1,2-dihydrophenyl)acetyl-CoA isomerase